MFETAPPLHTRALAMPHMREMLEAIAAGHAALNDTMPVETIWKRVKCSREPRQQQAHINAAREAGFVEETVGTGSIATKLRLTAKGYEAIGQKPPFWSSAA
jgi:hypothetical protein